MSLQFLILSDGLDFGLSMARWQNGYATDCKSVYLGSTPGRASTTLRLMVAFSNG